MRYSIDKTLDRLLSVCITSREICPSKRGDMLETLKFYLREGPAWDVVKLCLQKASDAGAGRQSNSCGPLLLPSSSQVLPIVPFLGNSRGSQLGL